MKFGLGTSLLLLLLLFCMSGVLFAQHPQVTLFDGESLEGWKASESQTTWKVQDGVITCEGPRSHLFYTGKNGDAKFKNFELRMQFKLEGKTNSGLFFHTEFSEAPSPQKGYEIQINSSEAETRKTGSLFAVRGIYADYAPNGKWNDLWLRVRGKRIELRINETPLIDYLEPENAPRSRKNRLLSSGTFALQAHDPGTRASYRNIVVTVLPDEFGSGSGDVSYLSDPPVEYVRLIDTFGTKNIPLIDYHIHLRGGMTVEKAVLNQAKTGIASGVLENAGAAWPLKGDAEIKRFIEAAETSPVFIGLQVNDRDWFTAIDPALLARLDYILADTMIMNDPSGKPVKLWLEEEYDIPDKQQWFDRYFEHCMTVVNEPITILANPTYLPNRLAKDYDRYWTEEKMSQFIEAGVKNNVAFEIQAGSPFPKERFLKLAKSKGAKFTIGRNNHDDKPNDLNSSLETLRKLNLGANDLLLIEQKKR